MVRLRPGKIDRNVDKPSYTRRKYMRGVPGTKVVHYDMGNTKRQFQYEVSISVREAVQIRHNALESARVISHRYLEKRVGRANYYMKIRAFPHEVLRENRMVLEPILAEASAASQPACPPPTTATLKDSGAGENRDVSRGTFIYNQSYLPIQNSEKIRFRISSGAVVPAKSP